MNRFLRILIIACALCTSSLLYAADNFFTGGTGNWNINANWSLGVMPTSADVAIIETGDIVTIPAGFAAVASRLHVGAGGNITIAATSSLDLNGTTLDVVFMDGNASNSIINHGAINIGNSAITSNASAMRLDNGTFDNMGSIDINGATYHGILIYSNTFTNHIGASIEVDGITGNGGYDGFGVFLNSNSANFINSGTLEIGNNLNIDKRGLCVDFGSFSNTSTGSINVNNVTNWEGVYAWGGSYVNDGSIIIGDNSTLVGSGLAIRNTGSFTQNSTGTIDIYSGNNGIHLYTNSPTFTNNGGTIRIHGATYSGLLMDDNAIFNNMVLSNIEINNVMYNNGLPLWGASILNNFGNIKIGNTGSIAWAGVVVGGTSVFNNNTGGDIDIDNSNTYGAIYMDNGTFNNSASIDIGKLGPIINGEGLVIHNTSGTFNNNAGGVLDINNLVTYAAIYISQSGSNLNNAGLLSIGSTSSTDYGLWGPGLFENTGMMLFNDIVYTAIDGLAVLENNTGGTVEVVSSGKFRINNGRVNNNTGSAMTVNTSGELFISPSGILTLDGTAVLTNNGSATIESDTTGTGALVDWTTTGTSMAGSSSYTVQQYISPGSGLGQRFFGSPINNGIVNGLDVTYTGYPLGQIQVDDCSLSTLQSTSPYSNILQWNENMVNTCDLEGWEAISASAPLTNGRGYSGWVTDGTVLEFNGMPNTGLVSNAGLDNSSSGISNADGWHMLSNPYPSSVNVGSLQTLNGANFSSYMYYLGSSSPYNGSFQPLLPGDNLSPMQGFIANTSSLNTFNFNNTTRVVDNTSFKSTNSWFDYKLDVVVEGNSFSDVTYLYFNSDASSDFDNKWDCMKKESDSNQPTIYSGLVDNKYALNGLNNSDFGESTIPVGLIPGTDGSFKFNFVGISSFPEHTTLYLEDKLLNIFHNIENGDYTFNSTTNDDFDRFEIHFVKPVDFDISEVSCTGEDGRIKVINETSNRTYELIKDNIVLTSGNIFSLDENVTLGDYILKVYDELGGNQIYDISINKAENINSAIEISSTKVETGDIVVFNNLTTLNTNIVWEINNQFISNANNLTYSFIDAGVFNVKATVSNDNCYEEHTSIITVSDKTTGIISLGTESYMNIYSKNGNLEIVLTNPSESSLSIALFTMLGQQVLQNNIKPIEKQTIELSDVNFGYYFVKVLNNDKVISSKKILIE